MIRFIILPCLVVASAASADGKLLVNTDTTWDLRLVAGITPGIASGRIASVQVAGHPAFDQDIGRSNGLGAGAGVRGCVGIWSNTEFGWRLGLEAAAQHTSGSVPAIDSTGAESASTTKLSIQTATGMLLVGPVFRVEQDSLDFPGDFFEIEVLIGAGYGSAQATNSGTVSSAGQVMRGQAEVGIVCTSFSRVQYGLSVGYAYVETQGMRWNNTGDADITLSGITAQLSLGYRL